VKRLFRRKPELPECEHSIRRQSDVAFGIASLILPCLILWQPPIALAQSADQNAARVFRDPVTGRTYRQELKTINVPSTQWQNKPITRTVYERQVTTRYVPTTRVVYAPVQTYALTQSVRGWWNPFRSPYHAYSYQPVTAWQPTLQHQTVPVTREKWVPKQQTVYVPEPVKKTEVRQQLVTTEIPSSVHTPQLLYARQPAPRLRIPLLAKQQVFPLRSSPSPTVGLASMSGPQAPTSVSSTRLRAVGSAAASATSRDYAAPLRTASTAPTLSRDAIQTGMSATILR
jgi:hypothetical protein